MRRFTFLFWAFVLGTATAKAQTVATFDTLSLAHADTFYTNYTASGTDVGFNDGHAHFPCVYDTSWGGFWDHGFAYSNMTDSITSGYMNGYSAKAGTGHAGSAQYAVAYGTTNQVKLTGAAMGHPVKGLYVTNNTYAYNSMRDGDMFSRQFHNGDWFLLTAKGYYGGVLKSDSVGFYLANFLHPDPSDNYILKSWEWFNLEPLGKVDSVQFTLTSTDTGFFGMNTPAYFCLDDFTTFETFDTTTPPPPPPPPPTSLTNVVTGTVKMYPNPARNILYVDVDDNKSKRIAISDITGKVVTALTTTELHNEINTAALPSGVYLLRVYGNGKLATMKFVKE